MLGLAELHYPFQVLRTAILLIFFIDFEFFLLAHIDYVALVIGDATLGVHENFKWSLLAPSLLLLRRHHILCLLC